MALQETPNTGLTFDTAGEAYNKLKPFIALKCDRDSLIHDFREPTNFYRGRRNTIKVDSNVFACVLWRPSLKAKPVDNSKWRRLTFEEFCRWYGIELTVQEATYDNGK